MRQALAAATFAALLTAALPAPAQSAGDGDPRAAGTADTKPPISPAPHIGRPIALHAVRAATPARAGKEQAAAADIRPDAAPKTYTGVIQ